MAISIKLMGDKGSHLEREVRVIRRLNCDVQHGGQNCSKSSIPSNPVNIILARKTKKLTIGKVLIEKDIS